MYNSNDITFENIKTQLDFSFFWKCAVACIILLSSFNFIHNLDYNINTTRLQQTQINFIKGKLISYKNTRKQYFSFFTSAK